MKILGFSPAPLNYAPPFYGKTVVQNNPILLNIPQISFSDLHCNLSYLKNTFHHKWIDWSKHGTFLQPLRSAKLSKLLLNYFALLSS